MWSKRTSPVNLTLFIKKSEDFIMETTNKAITTHKNNWIKLAKFSSGYKNENAENAHDEMRYPKTETRTTEYAERKSRTKLLKIPTRQFNKKCSFKKPTHTHRVISKIDSKYHDSSVN